MVGRRPLNPLITRKRFSTPAEQQRRLLDWCRDNHITALLQVATAENPSVWFVALDTEARAFAAVIADIECP